MVDLLDADDGLPDLWELLLVFILFLMMGDESFLVESSID